MLEICLQNITINHVIEASQNDLTFLGGEEVCQVEVEACQEDYNALALYTREK